MITLYERKSEEACVGQTCDGQRGMSDMSEDRKTPKKMKLHMGTLLNMCMKTVLTLL